MKKIWFFIITFFTELLAYLKLLAAFFGSFTFWVLAVIIAAFFFLKPLTGLLQTQKLLWLVLFFVAWGLYFKESSLKKLKENWIGGAQTLIAGSLLENFFIRHEFWADIAPFNPLGEFPLFLALGPYTVTGLLFFQYIPEAGFKRFFYVFFWTGFAVITELLFVMLGAVQYKEWTWFHSYLAYFGVYMSVVGFYACLGHGQKKRTKHGFGFEETRPGRRSVLARLAVSPAAFLARPLYKLVSRKAGRSGGTAPADNVPDEGQNNKMEERDENNSAEVR